MAAKKSAKKGAKKKAGKPAAKKGAKSFDALVKGALRAWPGKISALWPMPSVEAVWLRAQPPDGKTTGPRLKIAGTQGSKTQPDGLWLFLSEGAGCADCVAIEACSSEQNFNDKRSRYSPSSSATVVHCPALWLGAKAGARGKARWELAGLKAAPNEAREFPVRFIRVVFFLKDELYKRWSAYSIPGPHEFVAPYSSAKSYGAQKMQDFLRQLSAAPRFYKKMPKAK